jgi:hypothetical protein
LGNKTSILLEPQARMAAELVSKFREEITLLPLLDIEARFLGV